MPKSVAHFIYALILVLFLVPARFEFFHDPTGTLAEKFQLQGMPTNYLIDKSGQVVSGHIGFETRLIDEYEEEIVALLTTLQLSN